MKPLTAEHTKEMKTYIQQSWESDDSERFPGPQPVSIERRHFPLLKKQPYMVCEKTDGTRYMLVCFASSDGNKVCAITDRAFRAFYLSLTIPRQTILDGELVERLNKSTERFIVQIRPVVKEYESVSRLYELRDTRLVVDEIYIYVFSLHHARPI